VRQPSIAIAAPVAFTKPKSTIWNLLLKRKNPQKSVAVYEEAPVNVPLAAIAMKKKSPVPPKPVPVARDANLVLVPPVERTTIMMRNPMNVMDGAIAIMNRI
jgi:hypothetical protein